MTAHATHRNYTLLRHLPTGFTATAHTQVAGRGRGNNVWVSPAGSLIFSTSIRHSMSLSSSAPIVFIQYLAAMAVVEGIKTYDSASYYSTLPVRLKWPNDIYACTDTRSGTYVKIGGILVNSSYSDGVYNLVVGVGVNATNAAPTTSLN